MAEALFPRLAFAASQLRNNEGAYRDPFPFHDAAAFGLPIVRDMRSQKQEIRSREGGNRISIGYSTKAILTFVLAGFLSYVTTVSLIRTATQVSPVILAAHLLPNRRSVTNCGWLKAWLTCRRIRRKLSSGQGDHHRSLGWGEGERRPVWQRPF